MTTELSRRTLLQVSAALAAFACVNATVTPSAQGATTVPAFADATTFGVKANGMADDAPAVRSAIASGAKLILLPPGVMIIGSTLNVPTGVTLAGAGQYVSVLSKGFSGDAVTVQTEAALTNLRVEGNGAAGRAGAGVVIPAGSGRQNLTNVTISNHQGPSLKFASLDAGSQSTFTNLNLRRHGSAPGTELYNIEIPDGQYLPSCPRKFAQIETNGQPAFTLGGANGVFITTSVLGRMRYTAETRDVQVSTSRLLNEDHWDFRGHANTIIGCDIRPRITVRAGSFHCNLIGNAHNLDNPIIREAGAHASNTIIFSGRFL